MKKQIYKLQHALLLALLIACGAFMPVATAAKTTTKANSSPPATASAPDLSKAVTQTYTADKSVQVGMLVQIKPGVADTVIPLDDTHISSLLGVVVPPNSATIVLTPQKVNTQQVLVTNAGHYDVLVSTQNGPVKTGDYLTVSALAGVAMKADQYQTQVIGKAMHDFSGRANVISSVGLTDSAGRKINAAIGRVPVAITVAHNPLYQKVADSVPGFLNKVATGLSNKPVSAARIYISLFVFTITAFITTNVVYSGVRSGMIAVGRNPLSKKSIIRSLIQTIIAGLIVFIAGVFAVYLLLKL